MIAFDKNCAFFEEFLFLVLKIKFLLLKLNLY